MRGTSIEREREGDIPVRKLPHSWLAWAFVLAAVVCQGNAQTPDAFNPSTDSDVYAMDVQPDGMIVLGGYFLNLGGQPCNYFGKLTSDGALNTNSSVGADSGIHCVAVQDDGKLLVGGEFGNFAGQNRAAIARLNADGSLDKAFNPGVFGSVFCMAVQTDGKILVGGHYTMLAGQPRNNIGRLNPDGSLDGSFNPGATKNSYTSVDCLALQNDGKILVGGNFTALGGQARTNIGRLNPEGSLETAFDPETGNAYSRVFTIAVQNDGKILVGGYFSSLGGHVVTNLGRLNLNGTLDSDFNSPANSTVSSLLVQADGRILVGGSFTNLAGATRTYIGRLNVDGTADPAFDPPPSGGSYPIPQMVPYVSSVALQADGKILLGGRFTTLAGQTRTNIGRLVNTEPATQSLLFDGASITWRRGGTSAEVWRTRFDISTNGIDWLNLGPATRVPGGWQVNGLAVATTATVRVRGFVTGGYCNGSTWNVENAIGPPAIITEPDSGTNNAGTLATFGIQAVGTGTLSYQWLKNGLSLADGGNISGSQTPSLLVRNSLGADAGGYSVIVSNGLGSVTSLVARLTVVDPFIVRPPTNTYADQGQTVRFSLTAVGTAPLNYQWRKNGTGLAAETASSLSLTNVQGQDAASYGVVVSNAFGTMISPAAVLTVNLATLDQWSGGLPYLDSLAVLSDGRVIVSGLFSSFPGNPFGYVARLNANGSVDYSFRSGSYNCIADSIVLQPDGNFLIGGWTTPMAGESTETVRRLYPDGIRDSTFNPGGTYEVVCLLEQPDSKIVVGGSFTTLGGQSRNRIGRLNANGTLDMNFDPGASGGIWTMAWQPDGKILVGGAFASLAGQPRSLIGRLYPDGTLDTTFNPGADGSYVNCLVLQPDGKILVGGSFASLGGQPRNGIGRLNSDGSPDLSFNPGLAGSSAETYCILLQADGQIILGGWFTTLGGLVRTNIGRVNSDGTVDLTFNPGPSSSISSTASYCLALQADGKLLVGGVARLNNTKTASQSLVVDGAGITWLRGGSSPEVWRTTFECSTNGADWASLGCGVRIPGGWRLANSSFSTDAIIRARGYVTGGIGNRSSWFVESSVEVGQSCPVILVNDNSLGFRTNAFGFNVAAILGQTVVIQASTDMVNWSDFATNTFGASPFYFSDPSAMSRSNRFYRAKVQ